MYRMGRSQVTDLLDASFREQAFPGEHGPLHGGDLTVVKKSKQNIESSYGHVYSIAPDAALHTADAFWYCVGPGPCWFLAIPVVTSGFGQAQVRWIVRPMTEGRMRAALQFDRKATRLAFGERPVVR
ncbi:hypothetical protein [Xanthomonas rydalmerensis]|uniref:Uncharacterized protein n=1 Tax=Xanthomonas rydalmerensis TaxID=3046274 RepID=A0ABZ0JNP5_9XANT|nr:hypothetical protein [Xanthomonas sp. DM-2023]WOS41424.1 hypothetical protein QN243_02820 [Xanthomonas sp. DM-2023]WOS45609.1 hypothetical protein QN242_02820 [Xanthomonas sp. DM-2023]WOS49788.1 hypothetical protein QN240_02820 [Xanthomonas sp. DM-2023]WOS53968.1 hypothetical protein QN244_02820 [Xanthomonas sp. DM-2023]WOS58151.1 hypothetical protein QN245_02820 [Xanthomonas sp. DM-2023]